MRFPFPLLLLAWILLTGTTTIIKEGDVEVGRFENNDGKQGIEVIQSERKTKTEVNLPPPPPTVSARLTQSPQGFVIKESSSEAIFTDEEMKKLSEASKKDETKIYLFWAAIVAASIVVAWGVFWFKRNVE